MAQLNRKQADEICEKAALKAIGFSIPEPGRKVSVSVEEVSRVAQDAAFNALRAAGNMVEDDARSAAAINRAGSEAERRHREWCGATGARF